MPLPPTLTEPPRHEEIVGDLLTWREHGVLTLRALELPALRRAALASGDADTSETAKEPAVLTRLVRSAIAPIAESRAGRCALVLLGLDTSTYGTAPNLLREDAAEIWGVTWERFRRQPQATVISIVADGILERCHAHRARVARLAMEQRAPVDTRLAIGWLERFEGYFALFSPVYAFGADLTAYRSTLLETERPWDRAEGSLGPDDPGYTQEEQAAGYGTFALYRLACVLAAEATFLARFGGLWLLSTPDAEVAARDALRDVTRTIVTNERDHSWLRLALDEARGEMHQFLVRLERDSIGRATHEEWQEWLATCVCAWTEPEENAQVEYFPTARFHAGIDPSCQVHVTIEACNRFCTLIEQEWLQVADWYGLTATRVPTDNDAVTAEMAGRLSGDSSG